VLGVWLVAATADAKKKDPLAPCRARCERIAKEAQEKLLKCTEACPKPGRGNMEAFQACTQSCGKKHRAPRQISCVSQCDSGELDKPAKKSKTKNSSHRHDNSVTRVRPETN
jgi:hypothetical protein